MFFVLSCAIVLVTHDTIGWLTIALVWLGHVTVTGAELFQSAGHWGFMSELTDADQRAEYQGAAHIGHTLGSVWAPALFTWLAMEHGSLGWITIAAFVIVATLTMGPSARAAERYLAATGRLSRCASARGTSRVGGDRHRAFLQALACDVLLLTEVRTDLDCLAIGPAVCRDGHGRWWAAVASQQAMWRWTLLRAPRRWRRSTAACVPSVLPWNGCAPFWPWHAGGTAEMTADAITGIEASDPDVWGGDWNHSLLGPEVAAPCWAMAILDALDRLELRAATAKLRHRRPDVRTIDHIAVPISWQVSSATRVDATGLSDHDAYVVETGQAPLTAS